MGLGFGYDVPSYRIFVGSLRKAGFAGDVVLATSTLRGMRRGVADYLRSQRVLAYPFEYSCGQSGMSRRRRKLLVTPGGCVLDDWYADGDRRGPRPLAIARYEMYETWLRQYAPETYALVLDTRDTFFQADPFLLVQARRAADLKHARDLYVFEESDHKTVSNCRHNRGWLACFNRANWRTPDTDRQPVRCSGSTMGSRNAMLTYVDAMIDTSDLWMCHHSGIPSDQGYHNYLILSGVLESNGLVVISNKRGSGAVHTIGALNGGDMPFHLLGPLDTKWKVRDPVKGFITNTDGTRSAVVHQFDRWAGEMKLFLNQAFVSDSFVPGKEPLYPKPFQLVSFDSATCVDMPWRNKHKKGCDRLRPENVDWISAAPERVPARKACCKFGGGIRTVA